MSDPRWEAVDDYLVDALLVPDAGLTGARKAADAAGLPPIAVAPNQGKLLHLLARMISARAILEIGTLGGYSTIWLARALPDGGQLTTLEVDPRHVEVARRSLQSAGVGDRVEVKVGPALQTLPTLIAAGSGPYDLVFIDADKRNNAAYVRLALELTRPGSVIVVDNVVRGGALADPSATDGDVLGTREVLHLIGTEPRLDGTAIQTIGSKGWDGFAVALVIAG